MKARSRGGRVTVIRDDPHPLGWDKYKTIKVKIRGHVDWSLRKSILCSNFGEL